MPPGPNSRAIRAVDDRIGGPVLVGREVRLPARLAGSLLAAALDASHAFRWISAHNGPEATAVAH